MLLKSWRWASHVAGRLRETVATSQTSAHVNLKEAESADPQTFMSVYVASTIQ